MKKLSDSLKTPKWSFCTGLQLLALLLLVAAPIGCSRRQVELSQKEQIMQAVDLYERGKFQEQEQNLDQAANLYQQSLAISPRPVVHYRLGLVQTRLGEYQKALENLEQAQALAPGMSQLVKNKKDQVQSLILINSEDVSMLESPEEPEAPKTLPEIEFQELPEDQQSVRAIIQSDDEIEKSDESMEAVEEAAGEPAVEEKPTAEPSPQKVAEALPEPTDTPRPPRVKPTATPAPASTPVPTVEELPVEREVEGIQEEKPQKREDKDKELDRNLTLAYEAADRGDYEAAINYFQEAQFFNPDDPKINYNLGFLYQEMGQFVRAYLNYKAAVEKDPNFGQAWNNLGYVMERLSRSEGALDCYEAAISAGNLDAYFNAGLLLEKKGRLEEALQHFRQYLQKGSNAEIRKRAQEHVRRLERRF